MFEASLSKFNNVYADEGLLKNRRLKNSTEGRVFEFDTAVVSYTWGFMAAIEIHKIYRN